MGLDQRLYTSVGNLTFSYILFILTWVAYLKHLVSVQQPSSALQQRASSPLHPQSNERPKNQHVCRLQFT